MAEVVREVEDLNRRIPQPIGGVRADHVDHFLVAHVLVVTDLRLGRRGEERLRELVTLDKPLLHRLVLNGSGLAVLAPRRAGDVAPHDALDVDAFGLLHDH